MFQQISDVGPFVFTIYGRCCRQKLRYCVVLKGWFRMTEIISLYIVSRVHSFHSISKLHFSPCVKSALLCFAVCGNQTQWSSRDPFPLPNGLFRFFPTTRRERKKNEKVKISPRERNIIWRIITHTRRSYKQGDIKTLQRMRNSAPSKSLNADGWINKKSLRKSTCFDFCEWSVVRHKNPEESNKKQQQQKREKKLSLPRSTRIFITLAFSNRASKYDADNSLLETE